MRERLFVIAEAGVNHNGSLDMAKKLVDAAAKAGADAVKFQTFRAENFISKKASKAKYQTRTTDAKETQFEMIKKLELDVRAHHALVEHCEKAGIQFLSSPFDLESADFLIRTLNLPRIKIPSGEITNAPLLVKIAHAGKAIILSTGMSTLGEVEQALEVLAFGYSAPTGKPTAANFRRAFLSEEGQSLLKKNVCLLHCTTEYPASFNDVNLVAMDTLSRAFGLTVGLSDHTAGISVAIAAAARGAAILEKHFTLDRTLPGPDHRASLEPSELKMMVESIRQVEEALGRGAKLPTQSEINNLEVVRKSLVVLTTVRKGETFTVENLGVMRPGKGISPMRYWEFLGRKASRDFCRDEMVEP